MTVLQIYHYEKLEDMTPVITSKIINFLYYYDSGHKFGLIIILSLFSVFTMII
jgi:hypothetical protein